MRSSLQMFLFVICFVFVIVASQKASAAVLGFDPRTVAVKVGDEFSVDIKIDSRGQTVNGAQGTLIFPEEQLEARAVSKEGSVFNFWLGEPTTATKGEIQFVAGASTPISGGSLHVLRITFRTKHIGTPLLAFEDAAVTANDGAGTNVLEAVGNASISILPAFATLPPVTSTAMVLSTSTAVLTPPPMIQRKPTPATRLPAKPVLQVEFYPDETKWYSTTSEFLVRWILPSDVSAIATAVSTDNRFVPTEIFPGLAEGIIAKALPEGVWYFHAQFRNNVGWGETAHYRIAIDKNPPTPFSIEIPSGERSDDPTPMLSFRASDALSGIDHYSVWVDGGERSEFKREEVTLPRLRPGTHRVVVQAVDRAGNIREVVKEFEILPILSPVITFMTPFLTTDSGESFVVKGRGGSADTVHVQILDRRGQAIAEGETKVAENKEWVFSLDRNLRKGEYAVGVWEEDARGAQSLAVQAGGVSVRQKPAIKIGFVELSWAQVVLVFLLLGAGIWLWFERQKMLRRLRYGLVEYDFYKMLAFLEKQVEEVSRKAGEEGDAERIRQELGHKIHAMSETIGRIKNYLPKEVEKLKE